ncbi:hypothetical protein [Vandammella animalimorsus]|nr:hypothetical protein [Vandammella animalimorsus]
MGRAPTAEELENAINALLFLRKEMADEQQKLIHAVRNEAHNLRQESGRFRQDIKQVVDGAGQDIEKAANQSLHPVTSRYRDAVENLSGQVGRANKLLMGWLLGIFGLLLLILFALWAVLGLYRREVAAEQAKLQSYENANQVLAAYQNSEATLCDGFLCVKPGTRRGEYRQAQPRETKGGK